MKNNTELICYSISTGASEKFFQIRREFEFRDWNKWCSWNSIVPVLVNFTGGFIEHTNAYNHNYNSGNGIRI